MILSTAWLWVKRVSRISHLKPTKIFLLEQMCRATKHETKGATMFLKCYLVPLAPNSYGLGTAEGDVNRNFI